MRNRATHRLTGLVSGAAFLPGAWAHPGHEHDPAVLASLAHALTGWGPLLEILAVATAAGYRLWTSNRH